MRRFIVVFGLLLCGSLLYTAAAQDSVTNEVPPISYGETVKVAFAAPNAAITLPFEGRFGDVLRVTVENLDGAQTRLQLVDPAGRPRFAGPVDPVNNPRVNDLVLFTTGTHRLVLTTANETVGTANVTLLRDDLPLLRAEGSLLTFDEGRGQQFARYVGDPGVNITVNMTFIEGESRYPSMTIYAEDAAPIMVSGLDAEALIINLNLPETGEIVVQFQHLLFSDAVYRVIAGLPVG
ncbi:MAG: hypothetical protein GYB67_01550 [Chloroflexi bacterium]|nr:hypothetical protein [Chloroflexota bacterium]